MDNTPIRPKINNDYEGTPSGIKTGFCVGCILLVFFVATIIIGYFVIFGSASNLFSSFDLQKYLEFEKSDNQENTFDQGEDQEDSEEKPEEKKSSKPAPKKY
ncbi:MAG: hypothetical protein ABII72_04300 [Parcubacteria group bacterium]